MNEFKLTELLEHAGERTTVGPPPIDAMHARVTRRRRRRTVAVCLAAAVAVVAAAGGTALLVRPDAGETEAPTASTSPGVALPGTRLVGVGHVAVAVPKEWGTNDQRCGTPQTDTVIVDLAAITYCLIARPAGVESLHLASGKPLLFEFHTDYAIEVDGVAAERQRTSCTDQAISDVIVCSGAVRIPSLDVVFRAESSTNAAEVDRMLERITIIPDHVGVPAFRILSVEGRGPSGEKYAGVLRDLGLKPKIQTTKSPSYDPGQVMAVSPIPGTMVPVGATVIVTVVANR